MNIHSLLSRRSLTRQCIYLHLYLALSLQRNQESPIWGTCWQSRGESSRNTTNSRWSSRSQCPRKSTIGWIETLRIYLGVFPLQTTTMVGIIGISLSATVRDITYTLSRCTTHFKVATHNCVKLLHKKIVIYHSKIFLWISLSAAVRDITYTLSTCTSHFENFVTEKHYLSKCFTPCCT